MAMTVARPVPGTVIGNPLLVRMRQLAGIGDGDLAAVERLCCDVRHVGARRQLGAQGHPAERVYVLIDGWACSFRLLADGRRQIVSLHVPGDIIGLEMLHLRRAGQATATLSVCMLAAVRPQALRALAAERRKVADALAWLGAVDTALLGERIACLGRRSARGHVAHLLCELLVRLTQVGLARGNGYTLPITQEEIADMVGLTSVHVNRVVQGLRHEGLIEYSGKNLMIRQWNALRDLAEFRADYLHLEGIDGTGQDFIAAPGRSEPAGSPG